MSIPSQAVSMDYIIRQVLDHFSCRVLWSEGRPCLEYEHPEQLETISAHVRTHFGMDVLDVFFTAVAKLEEE